MEKEIIKYLDIHTLVLFQNHLIKSRGGEEKEQFLQNIKTQGAIESLVIRPPFESECGVISGQRQMEICKELRIEKISAIIRHLTDEQAISIMVNPNLHKKTSYSVSVRLTTK